MKSEPEVFSIDDLARTKKTWWDSVRNYQARNFMMHDMKVGDAVLFYHSNSEPSGVAGLAKVCQESAPDLEQFNKKSEYFDEKATKEKPIWYCVQVEFIEKFKSVVSLNEIRAQSELSNMLLLKRGQRLSIQPVAEDEFQKICEMGRKKPEGKIVRSSPRDKK